MAKLTKEQHSKINEIARELRKVIVETTGNPQAIVGIAYMDDTGNVTGHVVWDDLLSWAFATKGLTVITGMYYRYFGKRDDNQEQVV